MSLYKALGTPFPGACSVTDWQLSVQAGLNSISARRGVLRFKKCQIKEMCSLFLIILDNKLLLALW